MNRACTCLTLCLFLIALTPFAASAEEWPGWRGPRGDGTSLETVIPIRWSATDNVAWKTPLPGLGHSSPVIWGDRIFLTTALDNNDRVLLCLDRKTGEMLWRRTVFNAEPERMHAENSCASSTPVTDGRRVYVTFLDGTRVVVAAYDFDGGRKWLVRPGQFDSRWGFCHSPVLWNDKVFVAACGKAKGVVAALDCRDGSEVWRIEPKKCVQAFSSPLIRNMAGRAQLIIPANSQVTSYNPDTGAVLWTADGPSEEYTATPVFSEQTGLLLCVSSWPKRILMAIRPDGTGNVTQRNVAWQASEGAPYVPSPIAVGDYFVTASNNKRLCCYAAATGKVLWQEKGVGRHHASPVAANGLVYFLNDDGVMRVIKPGPEFDLVATNELGEKTYASPVVSRGQMFLRTFGNLYCIGRER